VINCSLSSFSAKEIQSKEVQNPEAQMIPLSQSIRCPNCGSPGERLYLLNQQLIQTQCPACDYLLITCSRTGNVVEAYAPGISSPLGI
jgi:hypothetical protein